MKGVFNLLSLWSSWHSMPHLLLSWLVSLDRSFNPCDIVAYASVRASCIERGVQVSFWLRMSIWGWRPGAENAHDSWQSLRGVTWLPGGCLEHVGAWLQEASVLAQVRSVFEASFSAPATDKSYINAIKYKTIKIETKFYFLEIKNVLYSSRIITNLISVKRL